jgi:tRNA1(Val) A37 N6-methylase TrmN6
MLQGVRKHLAALVGRRTNHPAPAFPADGPTGAELRDRLRHWHAEAEERYPRLFLHGQPLLATRKERALFEDLSSVGLLRKLGPSIYQPLVRLFPLYGRFLATDALTHREPDQVFSLMFEQVYLVRNMGVEPGDDVLELCLGSGVNSLFAADVARSVTGVDINPRALAFARFNEELNGAAAPIAFLEGSLFEPVEGTRFDLILVNPPFELVPEGATWFLHSDGGEDGLDVIRTILAEAPRHLKEEGRFEMITWSPGSEQGPLLVDLMREAFPRHRIYVHVLDVGPIDNHLVPFRASPLYADWRARLAAAHLTEVSFLFVRAVPSSTPGVELTYPDTEVAACDALSDPWA